MKCHVISLLVLFLTIAVFSDLARSQEQLGDLEEVQMQEDANQQYEPQVRNKRTILLLKKKALAAGTVGFGLGVGVGAIKGYTAGRGGFGAGSFPSLSGWRGGYNNNNNYGYGNGGYGSGYGYGGATGYGSGYGSSYGGYYGGFRPSYYNRYNGNSDYNSLYNDGGYYVNGHANHLGYNGLTGQCNHNGNNLYNAGYSAYSRAYDNAQTNNEAVASSGNVNGQLQPVDARLQVAASSALPINVAAAAPGRINNEG
ncbi:hypothetical protein TKK_0017787 [Trichogramma kaykai]|uniref:Uncharacterized protein n=1 Tax=Trichogramma kaykai TaxID=54128 RepID=A0ABD2W1M3_9HYME